jgi:hypothetical protein
MPTKVLLVLSCILIALGLLVSAPPTRAKDEKPKPEQLIAKYLESVGAPDKLKEIKTRSTAGSAHVDFRVGGQASLNGEGNLLSDGAATRLGLRFPALEYPGEQFVSDGTKTLIGQVSPGRRSPLGLFVFENDFLLKEGLLYGALSTNWALLNVAGRQPKLDVTGLKKIDGRSLYEMKYSPKKANGNIQVYLYFDPETFRHVRSQYKAELVSSSVQKITDTAETVRYTLTEEFDDFKQEDGLTLPHAYKIDYSIDSPTGGFVGGWSYTVKQVAHNQTIEKNVFATN